MTLPQTPSIRSNAPVGPPTWWWRCETSSGELVDAELARQRFHSQAEAETWLGEVFGDLVASGVDQVTLLSASVERYGPMSLHQ